MYDIFYMTVLRWGQQWNMGCRSEIEQFQSPLSWWPDSRMLP